VENQWSHDENVTSDFLLTPRAGSPWSHPRQPGALCPFLVHGMQQLPAKACKVRQEAKAPNWSSSSIS